MTDKRIEISSLIKDFSKYVSEQRYHVFASVLSSIIQCVLLVSWMFYLFIPVINDMENYGVTSTHYDPIVVLSLAGFGFLSFWFVMNTVWYYQSKYISRLAFFMADRKMLN